MLPTLPIAKTLFVIILSSLCFLSCGGKKEDPSIDGFYVKFKADGNQYIIKDAEAADLVYCTLNNGNPISYAGKTHYEFALSGLGNQGGPYPILNMTIESKDKIAVREYKLDELDFTSVSKKMFGQLPVPDVQKKYDFYGASQGGIITITEITATSVRGTFSGTILNQTSRVQISEGEFYSKRTD